MQESLAAGVVAWAGYGISAGILLTSLVIGLLHISRYMERHINTTRHLLRSALLATCAGTIVLWIVDQPSLWQITVSLGAQYSYWRLLKAFPWITANLYDAVIAVIMLIWTHVAWLLHFR